MPKRIIPQRKIIKVKSFSFKKILGIFLLGGFLFFCGGFFWIKQNLPDPKDFEKRIIEESTKIYSREGILLYETGEKIKRTIVPLSQISPYLIKATIAAEDENFYHHFGIDIKGILRALYHNIFKKEEGIQGGSTITQQLVKNALFLKKNEKGEIVGPAPRTISRKIKEAVMAILLERKYSKDKILEFYLNQIPYGGVLYGCEAASRYYFGKNAKDLSLDEAATLASLPRAPTLYLSNMDLLKKRRDYILDKMVELGFISKKEAESAKKKKIVFKQKKEKILAPYVVEEVKKELKEMFGEDYQRMGLRVYTTIDFSLQKKAEEIVKKWSSRIRRWYNAKNAALVAGDSQTGEILAMVGGVDFKKYQVNFWYPKSFQSPGSAFKPIVYAAAFRKGYTERTIIWDVKTDFGKGYTPENFDKKQRGPVKMEEALAQSLNIPAVKTLYLAGIEDTVELARKMGMIKSFENFEKENPGLSMAVGGYSIHPLELVSAYAVFSNGGSRIKPHLILKIESRKGEIVYQPEIKKIKVLDKSIVDKINYILSDNNLRAPMFGTRSWLYVGPYVAAKTGTAATKKGRVTDTWTIGYTKNLVVGVWAGNQKDTDYLYSSACGAKTAAPIFFEFMREATKNSKKEPFKKPPYQKTGKFILDGYLQTKYVKVEKYSGKLASSFTPSHLIERKKFFVCHSILYYVLKDDPQGPYPRYPQKDPMFYRWEKAIKNWCQNKKNFSPPREKETLHSPDKKPKIEILEKKRDGENVYLKVKISSPFQIKTFQIFANNNLIKEISNPPSIIEFNFQFPEEAQFSIKVKDKYENQKVLNFTL